MRKVGNKLIVSTEEIIACKGNERNLGKLLALMGEWVNAKSYRLSKRFVRATQEEFKSWLGCAIWESVEKSNETITISNLTILAAQRAINAYDAQYQTAEARDNADLAISLVRKGEDGDEIVDIAILDESLCDSEFRSFLKGMESKLDSREYQILNMYLKGDTFESIGNSLRVSKQYASKVFKDRIRPILAREYSK